VEKDFQGFDQLKSRDKERMKKLFQYEDQLKEKLIDSSSTGSTSYMEDDEQKKFWQISIEKKSTKTKDERRSVGRAGGQRHSSLQAFLLGDRGERILSEEDPREDQTCRCREEGNAQYLGQPTDDRKNVETQSTSVDNGGESPAKKTNEASGDAIDEQNSSPTEEIGDEEEKLIASRPRLLSIEPL
jgi:hypothetical protein